jgi:cytidine deaminase
MFERFLGTVKVVTPEQAEVERLWIVDRVMTIGEVKLTELASRAIQARAKAYQPYSNYSVGVAILCTSGVIYDAPNIEVVTYSQTGHAEHNAINKAISEGEGLKGRNFIEAMVVCHSGDSESCGACRQEIAEHCDNTIVINVDPEGNPLTTTSLETLLPFAFTPKHLGK